ncbi:L-erythro-3,5-diaminohexanoate dehydrogenase [Desmospora profundinema]|uniref:L-erythro-3,5-diaminohexanoate dehydrogenase n=1 Tax=Desmospora profundinema TaxID=1571184 RepID=A0ABU1IKX7_9BACL|nr:L-erythro-3,5-diaminohexanoate dehydrogenase [Desmospora profundinema]MDR6225437.1 L-erythro-3,5-diaminohexanoate dehydrogenase [Desmospora profundinema]
MELLGDQSHPLGLHRVIEPRGMLPQPAWKVDAEPVCRDRELLIDVQCLNIDSASFNQLKEAAGQDPEKVKDRIAAIVAERGKMHNPVTGSGGMLIGTVFEVGARFPGADRLCKGDRLATLVSLTLTPLHLVSIDEVDMKTGQVRVQGKAVLFASGPFALLPHDLPEHLSLAVLDVCGAPAQTARIVGRGQTVVVLGAGGKSGLLCLAQARRRLGDSGCLLALESRQEACDEIRRLQLADNVIQVDARNPVAVLEAVEAATGGGLADWTINCVNVTDTELSSILATRDGGGVYFFSTAIRFTAAALGAEGVGRDVRMWIGNGYAPGHADLALNTLRERPDLLRLFQSRYAAPVHG